MTNISISCQTCPICRKDLPYKIIGDTDWSIRIVFSAYCAASLGGKPVCKKCFDAQKDKPSTISHGCYKCYKCGFESAYPLVGHSCFLH